MFSANQPYRRTQSVGIFPPPRHFAAASSPVAMRQLESLCGENGCVSPAVNEPDAPGQKRHSAPLTELSSSGLGWLHATCRINGNNFPCAATPAASVDFCFFAFSPHALLAARTGRSCRSDFPPTPADTSASRQPRARLTPEQVPRGLMRKSDSGTVRVRGGGATAVRDGPGDERRNCLA